MDKKNNFSEREFWPHSLLNYQFSFDVLRDGKYCLSFDENFMAGKPNPANLDLVFYFVFILI